MNIFKRKQQVQPIYPKCPEPPKDDSTSTLETYAREKLIYDMHILNNFLESLYEEPELYRTNHSKDNKWVELCNNHINYVKDGLNSNYGDGANKKCKYCDSVFKGYMAGAMLEYHNNSTHKEQIEKELAVSMAGVALMIATVFKSMCNILPTSNTSDKE